MPTPSGAPSTVRPPSADQGSAFRSHWSLDPGVTFLNHGSFGACPTSVLRIQSELRARLERDPVRFFLDDYEPMLDAVRAELGAFMGASTDNLAFVPNATFGVNSVVRSLDLRPGDELLTTNHAYNACANALRFVAERAGARVVVADVPIPAREESALVDPILRAVTPRTRLALIDAISSQTAIVFPFARITRELQDRGVDVLLDAAHAPGMIDLRLDDLAPAYATGNLHKWTCAPKGAGFLYVRPDRQHIVRPAVISHGANATRTDRSRFHLEFDWTGTSDPTPFLCVGHAIRDVGDMVPGGWAEVRARNRAMALDARSRIAQALGVTPAADEPFVGSIVSFMLPDAPPGATIVNGNDPLHIALQNDHNIQIPVFPWPTPPRRMIRISAHLHNCAADYDRLIVALRALIPTLTRG